MKSDISSVVERLRTTFREGTTRPYTWRKDQLKALRRLLTEQEDRIADALKKDLGKCSFESWLTETSFTIGSIDDALRNLRQWMMPTTAATPLTHQPGKSYIVPDPLGVNLIIAPWNYPVQLIFAPLVGAIAAGNCVVFKPSEFAPATSSLIAEQVPNYLDSAAFAVVEGGVAETTELLEQKFAHIFFSGSTAVGKIVMAAAAKHLTKVTLELGGKSPCIIDQTADICVAARRVAWGKYMNSGQTCVAPDYLLIHSSVEELFIDEMRAVLHKFYGEDAQQSPDYGRIVNRKQFDRLTALLVDEKVVIGGNVDADDLYIEPTVLRSVSPESPVMADEIFGPILPMLTYENLQDAIDFVSDRPKPLALYCFSKKREVIDQVAYSTRSGGITVNDTVLHMSIHDLPFSGVGASGMGAYHGKFGFDEFSHAKAVHEHASWVDLPLRYPPYSDKKRKWLSRFM